MGADEELEQVVHTPTTDEQPGGGSEDAGDDLGELRDAESGGDDAEGLKANLKRTAKPGSNIEAEKANLK